MINRFTLGAIGSLISAISIGLIIVVDLFSPSYPIPLITYGRFSYILYTIIEFILIILLGVGILFASFGYREIKNSYGLLSGKAGFTLGIITSVLFLSYAVVDFVYNPYYMPYVELPISPIYYAILWLNLLWVLFFGLTHVIWGIVHFKVRKFCKKPKLSLLNSGFFIVSGVVILSVILSIFYNNIGLVLSIIGLVFSIISLLFASIVFWTFRSNI
jgi:hypothetical protein